MVPREIVKAQMGRFDCLWGISVFSAEVLKGQRDNLDNLKAGTRSWEEMWAYELQIRQF